MRAYLLRRLVHALVVVWGVVTFVFFLVRLTGDPAAFLVDPTATQAEIEHTRRLLGLDRSLAVQYGDFLAAIARGDFGQSMQTRRPALGLVLEHLWPATAVLAGGVQLCGRLPPGLQRRPHRLRGSRELRLSGAV